MALALAGAQHLTPRNRTPNGYGSRRSTQQSADLFAFGVRAPSELAYSGRVTSLSGYSDLNRQSNLDRPMTNRSTVMVMDFSSDVGRKMFGFSHEEMEDSAAYYEGQFKLHQRHGEGVMHNPETGAKYVGQFQNDVYHGEGTNTWPDGSTYVGQWRNGQKHGKGRYTCPRGLVYEGQWESGFRHGRGSQEYGNSDRYDGGWWHGVCSGLGTYYFSDGSQYEGAWAHGRYDGSGIFIGADCSRERQWYSNGLLMKREVLTRGSSRSAGPQTRRDMIGGKVVFGQTRSDMHRPALLHKQQPSKYLIQRETGGIDLSAPPLQEKPAVQDTAASTAPARLGPA